MKPFDNLETVSTKAAKILEKIDNFLSDPSIAADEKRILWDVLTALRGPDSGSIECKESTTNHIRRSAFPKTTQYLLKGAPPFGPSLAIRGNLTDVPKWCNGDDHFVSHLQKGYSSILALRQIEPKPVKRAKAKKVSRT